jgi:hypothetical protein
MPDTSLEIACDESGYEGEKLVGGVTDVFAHAGLHLGVEDAIACMSELRRRIRSPAQEYKANHLQRGKHRAVLLWLLGPSAPILGHAHVHLVDKTFLLVLRLVALTAAPDRDAMARTLCRDGRSGVAPEPWIVFLTAANDLLRVHNRQAEDVSVASFLRRVDALRGLSPDADAVLDLLDAAGPRIEAFRAGLPEPIPALDPLVPAIAAAVALWGGAVTIVHDRQTSLTPVRLARLPVQIRLVDSRSDPRVQLADVLAGVARKAASEVLAGRGDAELVALLRPYVSDSSVWGDNGSWVRLRSP